MADVERWITIHPNGADSKGQPIPVKEGQNNKQATESFLAKKKNKAINPEENLVILNRGKLVIGENNEQEYFLG